jgi:two-component system sensor histidine kinase VicK
MPKTPTPSSHQTLSHIIVNLNQTTTRLAHEKKQLESLLDNIAEAVIATDTKGHILRFNPTSTRLTDLPEVQALGKTCDQTLKILDGKKSLKFKTYCPVRSKKPRNYQRKNLQLLSKSGHITPVALSSSPIMDLLGHTGWVITIHDLTAEQELEQMKQDFVSIAAHQLRTPTTTILGYLEAIRDEQLSSAQKTFAT